MEESFGAQYALQIALHTLRERCQQFQHRITVLEEENFKLRYRSESVEKDNSLTEIDTLKQQVAQLTEQKAQLTNNVQMVSLENRRLWSRLSKLTQANENLGTKLNKINDTLTQHTSTASHNPHITLIRSRTFTQDEPHIKIPQRNVTDENDKISLELEDISLKIFSTIAKGKSELELQCSQMDELQNANHLINSMAFAYPIEDVDNTMADEVEEQLQCLKNIKRDLLQEREKLRKSITNFKLLQAKNNEKNQRIVTISVSVQTVEESKEKEQEDKRELAKLAKWGTPENEKSKPATECDKICPMCSKIYSSSCKFSDFQNHVESHFVAESDNLSHFEIIP